MPARTSEVIGTGDLQVRARALLGAGFRLALVAGHRLSVRPRGVWTARPDARAWRDPGSRAGPPARS